jgi:hypothetical protein
LKYLSQQKVQKHFPCSPGSYVIWLLTKAEAMIVIKAVFQSVSQGTPLSKSLGEGVGGLLQWLFISETKFNSTVDFILYKQETIGYITVNMPQGPENTPFGSLYVRHVNLQRGRLNLQLLRPSSVPSAKNKNLPTFGNFRKKNF